MDISLAKGLTKEFFRLLPKNLENKLNEITPIFVKFKNNPRKFIFEINNLLKSDSNNFSIHFAEFGTKRKPKIAFTALEIGDYHASFKRDESLLIGEQVVIHSDPFRIIHTGRLQFIISHHVIQRMFQRNPEIKQQTFDQSFKIIKNELEFLNFWTLIWNTLFSNNTFKSEDLKNINFPIPTNKGLIYGQFSAGDRFLDCRTYISDEMLSLTQRSLKKLMIKMSDPYLKNHLNYYFYSEEIDKNKEIEEFELLFQYIIFQISTDLKNLLPTVILYKNKNLDYIVKTTTDAINFLYENIDNRFDFSKDIFNIKNKNTDFLNIYRKIKIQLN